MTATIVQSVLSISMFFIRMFVNDKIRQQEIHANMLKWFEKVTNKGADISNGMTDLERQEEELKKTRVNEGDNGQAN